MQEQFVTCQCTSIEHIARLSYDSEDGSVYMTVHLSPLPLYKRLWNALRYVLGHRSKYGEFQEIVLDDKSLINVLVLCSAAAERRAELLDAQANSCDSSC